MQPQLYCLYFAYLTWTMQMQCSITYQKNILQVPNYSEHLHQDSTKQIEVFQLQQSTNDTPLATSTSVGTVQDINSHVQMHTKNCISISTGTCHHQAKCKRRYEVQQQGNSTQSTKRQKGNICCQGIYILSTNIKE